MHLSARDGCARRVDNFEGEGFGGPKCSSAVPANKSSPRPVAVLHAQSFAAMRARVDCDELALLEDRSAYLEATVLVGADATCSTPELRIL